jgi:hypothetical protein
MAIHAIDLHTTKTISHPDDQTDPTMFTIQALDSRVLGDLADSSLVVAVNANGEDEDADVKMASNRLAFETVQFGLKDIKNFKDKDGDVLFSTENKTVGSKSYKVAKANLVASIPSNVVQWLSDEIKKLNILDTDEGN